MIEFSLAMPKPAPGRAWLRTNLGRAAILRGEIIARTEQGRPILARDWHDIPMHESLPGRFSVRVPLTETGAFEAKACFLPEGAREPVWPPGPNVSIKVEPAEYSGACSIYTAFVRQFGPNCERRQPGDQNDTAIRKLDEAGYAVIPRSGTFHDLIRHLDLIIGKLRCRIVQLLPIHPTPTVYARMGRFGSPFAVLDFMDVEPALAEFDRRTTPLDQFRELVDAVHVRDGRLFIDIPINHTGWASWLQIHHPAWFARNEDRSFQSPGAWGVTWEDLSKLDYAHLDLWRYIADVFLYWCAQGVDGFRCDAGYMIPAPVWQYVVAKVRDQYPDTVFMLEGLGGSREATQTLLTEANLDWAYSELFQTYDQTQMDAYLPGHLIASAAYGPFVHFAETHDNLRLAAVSHRYARFRTALAALCSQNGAFGIANGVEWFATERIAVHEAASLNWNAPDNQVEHVARLNAILQTHPAFLAGASLRTVHQGSHNTMALLRTRADGTPPLLVLANLNDSRPGLVVWPLTDFDPGAAPLIDLVSGRSVHVSLHQQTASCMLKANEALCLTANPADAQAVDDALARGFQRPPHCVAAEFKAKALELHAWRHGSNGIPDAPSDTLIAALGKDPRACLADIAGTARPPLTTWHWPHDLNRVVMLPPDDFLLLKAPAPFLAEARVDAVVLRRERSLPAADGTHFVLFPPLPPPAGNQDCTLALTLYESGRVRREQARLLRLAPPSQFPVRLSFGPADFEGRGRCALCTNGRGAMAQVRARWADLVSQYDAFLAANMDSRVPVERRIILTRWRGWVIHRGYSQELTLDCMERFDVNPDGTVRWVFLVPSGMGTSVRLEVALSMERDANRVSLRFFRHPAGNNPDALPDPVTHELVLRPDVDDRSCHEITKAYLGPEAKWPAAVQALKNGFVFAPSSDRRLVILASSGSFILEPEWRYMVPYPFEQDRGLNSTTDLFSPGYFRVELAGGQQVTLDAGIAQDGALPAPSAPPDDAPCDAGAAAELATALRSSLRHFIVKRNDSLTVIAGYPWFLDWSRDTLICLRGIVAAGWLDEARKILLQFASLESGGTLPNALNGNDLSNRDSSDSPLWLFVATADLLRAEGNSAFLDADCDGRRVRDVLRSIAQNYLSGTSNGIVVDVESGLVFSPSHFTWMDTRHPAATPREGYPIEIQALWTAALDLMAGIEPSGPWAALRAKARESVRLHFARAGLGFLSDCLHAAPGQPARLAAPDDALRPNQLLAITLGVVREPEVCSQILDACAELLVPGAIRSLADRPVTHPLEVRHRGALVNDPQHPYWGQYRGDEDTRRKPAYHNGTAWTWLFPSYAEALAMTFGPAARRTALSLLSSSLTLVNRGCVGHVPEILDGDAPHAERGCGAQAWGASELYRVLTLLTRQGD